MNSRLKKGALLSLLVLLATLGIGRAWAMPGEQDFAGAAMRTDLRSELRAGMQMVQFYPYAQQQDGRQNPNRDMRNDNRRGGNADGPRHEQSGPQNEGRQNRMSPDERRALRRQINEAGQDIYRPKR